MPGLLLFASSSLAEASPTGSDHVAAGGPCKLVWQASVSPCELGHSFGLACLRAYRGDRLLLVGEWRGATFGRRSESGESFSAEFQREVEAGFVREELHRLPTWPGSLDHVAVWRRRRT